MLFIPPITSVTAGSPGRPGAGARLLAEQHGTEEMPAKGP